jgi:hypothetical protein
MSIRINESMLSVYGTTCKACGGFYQFRAHVTTPPSKQQARGRCSCGQINLANDLAEPEGNR